MPINNLYGYDTGQYGYARANQTPQLIGRQYPAWMTDPNARGIGVAQSSAYAPPPPIAIPPGDGSGGFNQTPALIPPPAQNGQDAAGAGWPGPTYGAEGGGVGGGADFSGGMGGVGPSQSFGDTLGAIADLFGAGGDTNGSPGGVNNGIADGGFGYGGVDPGNSGGTPGGTSDAAMADGGFGFGGVDPGFGMYRGGVVTPNRLQGPNPPGPDDGYAALNVGEGVLTAAAMKHYGPAFLRKLNKLQVPKGR